MSGGFFFPGSEFSRELRSSTQSASGGLLENLLPGFWVIIPFMKLLGVDWGEKRIGLAIARGNLAEPFEVVSSFEELAEVIRQEGIRQIVLGLPEGKYEKRVKGLSKRIETGLGIPVVLRSEVLTSREALKKLIAAGKPKKARANLDAASAALLLQEYLDENPIA